MTWGTTQFQDGRGIALVARETLALVVSDDGAIRDTLWELVAVDAPVDEILEGLSGHGLRNLPSFAIVRVEGEQLVRVVVRGSASVQLVTDDGLLVVESRSAKTWVEREVSGVVSVELSAEEADRKDVPVAETPELPFHVLAGSVPASVLRRSLVVADRHATAAEDTGWSAQTVPPSAGESGPAALDLGDVNLDIDIDGADEAASDPVAGYVVEADPSPDEASAPYPVPVAVADEEVEAFDPAFDEGSSLEPVSGEAPLSTAELSDVPAADADEPDSVSGPGAPLPPPAFVTPTAFDSGATLLPSDLDRLQWPPHEGAPDVDRDAALEEPVPSHDPVGSAGAADDLAADGAGDDAYDHLFGHTVARSVQQAAVQAPADGHDPTPSGLIDEIPGGAAAPGSPQLGDHDGHTISRAELERMRNAGGGAGLAGAAPAAPVLGPTVQARLCTSGHPNPTHLTVCRSCGGPMSPNPPVAVARPVLGVLRFSNGLVVHLDRPQLIGRSPKVEGHVGGEIPNLVRLDEAGQGVSRRHVAIHLENWQVLLEDLNSANGTIVALPGRPARRLIAGEPIALEPGAVVDLGGEMSIAFEASR